MTNRTSRRSFIVRTTSGAAALAVSSALTACGGDGDGAAPSEFKYGVASGDPLADRVILWTHARIPGSSSDVGLTWQVATDASFGTVVSSGRVVATEAASFTAKVDATGLTAGTSYCYRFIDDAGVISTVGTTRTLPTASATSVKLAVFSCAMYTRGFFNVYGAAVKSDAQYAIHLGDYIYEYGYVTDENKSIAVELGRENQPAYDILTLGDYRTRYALYRSDPDLQALHARMPWITVWDDHEFANNAYMGGAQNHNPATQGDWNVRKAIASKVYHEWMPIRTPDTANLLKIYRRFDFGKLLTLHMLDTRIEGRDRQYDNYGDSNGLARYAAGMKPDANGVVPDAARRMISAAQQDWLTEGLTSSTAAWQVLGNQDMMARLWFPTSVMRAVAQLSSSNGSELIKTAITDYLTAKATRATAGAAALTPAQKALLDPATNPSLPYSLDSWDGYPSNRDAILKTARALKKPLITLTGDSHNAWFSQLTTLAGEKAGVEFAVASVTTSGFDYAGLGGIGSALDGSILVSKLGNAAIGAGLGLTDDLFYAETANRGYTLITVTADAVQGEYVFTDTIKSRTYTAKVGRTIKVAASGAISYA